MPLSSWQSVAGMRCENYVEGERCKNAATHWYGMIVICCECHGGYLFTNQEAELWHILILAQNAE
jgi:hypothetical protein